MTPELEIISMTNPSMTDEQINRELCEYMRAYWLIYIYSIPWSSGQLESRYYYNRPHRPRNEGAGVAEKGEGMMDDYDDAREEATRRTDRYYEIMGYDYPDRHDPEYLDRLYDNLQTVYDGR